MQRQKRNAEEARVAAEAEKNWLHRFKINKSG